MSITLNELLEGLYGVKTFHQINQTVSAIGVASIPIMKGNPNRVSFLIVNLSANAIYISPMNDVSATKGIYVAPNGGSVLMQWDRDFELVSQTFYGIAAGAASSVYILENISI
jgi:hypothetical protein